MCSIDRFFINQVLDLFGGAVSIPPTDRWNFPKKEREIVRRRSDGTMVLEMARWGLEPQWYTPDPKISTYNARDDSLAQGKPLFRDAFERKRCLMFGTSFVEHSDRRPSRVPIEVIPFDGEPYAYAGLFESAERFGEPVLTCSMVTCEPNDLIADFHSRMPVLLSPDNWDLWVNPRSTREDLLALLEPFNPEGMRVRDAVLPPRGVTNKPKAPSQSETLF